MDKDSFYRTFCFGMTMVKRVAFIERYYGMEAPSVQEHVEELLRLSRGENRAGMKRHVNAVKELTTVVFARAAGCGLSEVERLIARATAGFYERESVGTEGDRIIEPMRLAYERLDWLCACADVFVADGYVPCNPGDGKRRLWMATHGAAPFEPGPVCTFYRCAVGYDPNRD